MDWEQAWATGHVAAASLGLVVGIAVLSLPKGTGLHRLIGAGYACALILVDLAGLLLHRESAFGVFHALAVASLLTVAVGLVPLLRGSRSPRAIAFHAYCMTWSYLGLVAAGVGQLAAALDPDAAWTVPMAIGIVLALGGGGIHDRVPSVLARLPAR